MTDKAQMPDVVLYLLGEGRLEGHTFPDFPDNGEKYKRRYWWRKHLRDAWQTRTPQAALQQEGDVMKALELAAKTFRWYEELHRAKPDHEKADRNKELAETMEAALQPVPRTGVEPAAYWVRYDDGSGRIFENKEHADHYAEKSYSDCEVVPVYTNAAHGHIRTDEVKT